MNIQQIGLGTCNIHGTPILSQVGIQNSKVCFACQEDAKQKTGRTVVVSETTPDATGRVTIMDVKDNKETTIEVPTVQATGEIIISLSLLELTADPIRALLQAAYDAIDNMPPFKTLKETKQAIALQEEIQELLTPKVPRKRRTKEEIKVDSNVLP